MKPVGKRGNDPGRPDRKPIAVLVSFSGDGGVERMLVNLLDAFAARGYPVDLLLIKAQGPYWQSITPAVNVIHLRSGHTFTSLPAVTRYLWQHRPQALLAAKERAGQVALWARRLSAVPTRVVVRLGTTRSAAMKDKNSLLRWLRDQSMRVGYRSVDTIVAVSQGVADDIARTTALPAARIRVICNPVVTPKMLGLAQERLAHPWLQPDSPPVILAAGRFTKQKDFSTLIRAFQRVRQSQPCRLIILGKGQLQSDLESLASELGIREEVHFPGFVANPYAYMARAALFVLSSAWEGSPNVLTEALALGTPVVATDCPSGPREILQDGRYGRLVPVADVQRLGEAMIGTLTNPLPSEVLRRAAAPYSVNESAGAYLNALGV
jgi:glycosyltransferase involved in cell wall biosynthesis